MFRRRFFTLVIGVVGAIAAYALFRLRYPEGGEPFSFLVGLLSGVIKEFADLWLSRKGDEPPEPVEAPRGENTLDLHAAAAALILLFAHIVVVAAAQALVLGFQSAVTSQVPGIGEAAYNHLSYVAIGGLGFLAGMMMWVVAFAVGFAMKRMRYWAYIGAFVFSSGILLAAQWIGGDPTMLSVRDHVAIVFGGAQGAEQTASFNALARWLLTGIGLNAVALLAWILWGLFGRFVRARVVRLA